MDQEEIRYEIIITDQARESYYQLLDVIFDRYSQSRFDEISEDLYSYPDQLRTMPERGSLEPFIELPSKEYRYILYRRSNTATVKIVYYIDHQNKEVYITDYFPTEMNPDKVKG